MKDNYKVSKDTMLPFSGPDSTRLRIIVPLPPGSKTFKNTVLSLLDPENGGKTTEGNVSKPD
jgi:hypothetical protein